jgi:hypothetical protein
MSADQPDDLRACVDAFTTYLGYHSARNKIDRLSKLFSAAEKIMWEGNSYPAQFDAMYKTVVAKYGKDVVDQQLGAARTTLKEEAGMKPLAAMWIVLALVFAKRPVEFFSDGEGSTMSHGVDIDAQVCHLSGGRTEAWDENLRMHPGLVRLTDAREAVNSLYITLNILTATSIESLIS